MLRLFYTVCTNIKAKGLFDNLFPVWTYWGQGHYSGSMHNMFEVWRWSGGWRGPSRWDRRLLRAAEWERKEDASQQARQMKMSGSGAANSQLTHVGLPRSKGVGGWKSGRCGTSSYKWVQTPHTEMHHKLSSLIFSICPFVIIKVLSEWGEIEFT